MNVSSHLGSCRTLTRASPMLVDTVQMLAGVRDQMLVHFESRVLQEFLFHQASNEVKEGEGRRDGWVYLDKLQ